LRQLVIDTDPWRFMARALWFSRNASWTKPFPDFFIASETLIEEVWSGLLGLNMPPSDPTTSK
jgi:hypothetical protein